MRLTLGKKLGLGFVSVLSLMVLSAVLTYMKANSIKETQDRAMTVRVPTIETCISLQRDLNQTQSKGRQVILAGSQPARWEVAKKTFDSNWDDVGKDVAALKKLSSQWSLQSNRDQLAEIEKHLPDLRQVQETAMKHAMISGRDAVIKAGNEYADKAARPNPFWPRLRPLRPGT